MAVVIPATAMLLIIALEVLTIYALAREYSDYHALPDELLTLSGTGKDGMKPSDESRDHGPCCAARALARRRMVTFRRWDRALQRWRRPAR